MSIFNSIIVALFCFLFVFVVLAILFSLIRLLPTALDLVYRRKKAAEDIKSVKESNIEDWNRVQASYGELKLKNVDEKTAALIMAIVSDESGIPLQELQFKSIKAVD